VTSQYGKLANIPELKVSQILIVKTISL